MNAVEMLFENLSPYGFDETITRIASAVEEKGWKTPAVHDLQQTMKNFGKEVLPVKVFEICHPKHSSRILESDNERIVSAMMPCRISVYERSDGKTYVSRINSGKMSALLGGLIEEVMKDATADVEGIVEKALSK
jgi:uncharacterized protein (DUF302 family)